MKVASSALIVPRNVGFAKERGKQYDMTGTAHAALQMYSAYWDDSCHRKKAFDSLRNG